MRWILCCIIFGVATGMAAAQTTQPTTQRAAGRELPKSIPEFEEQIKYYRYYKQDSAIFLVKEGISFARQNKDSVGVAALLVQWGMIDDNLGLFDSAREKYEQAMANFQYGKHMKGVATTTVRLGVVDLRNGKYDLAIKYFYDALKISEKLNDRFGMMEAYYSISWAWLDQKNYKKALEFLKMAEELNLVLPFSNISLNIYNHFGVVYRELKEYEKAKHYLQLGIDQSDRPEYQGLNITMINNLASVYSKQGDTEKAIRLQEQALQRSRQIGNYLRELQTLLGLSRTYSKFNHAIAVDYLNQGINLARQKNSPRQEIRFLGVLADQAVAARDYKTAFEAKNREHELSDSFLYKTMSQNMEALKSEYELSKSKARIKELDLQNQQRQLELKSAGEMRKLALSGIVLLLVIIALLYNQYRIKQKNTRELNKKNLSLERLLDEKEWLLKEVHHRVKNNLQTVMSLLETQSSYLKDDALVAVQNSQHRVFAMSLIHQKLYQLEHSTSIDLAVYLPELIRYLCDSYDVKTRVQFQQHIESIQLDISHAIPVGLIFNEAISNSLKYAFPGGKQGKITVESVRTGSGTIRLSVWDNGVGLPEGWENLQENSLGVKLMKGLGEDIDAKFTMANDGGTRVQLEFVEAPFIHSKN